MPSIQRGPRKPAPRAKIRVSQGTIDKIKGMGMQAALKKASRTSTSGDFVEGVKRMYGARRLTAAKMKRADSRIEKPSLRQPKAKRPGAVTAKKGTSMAKAKKPTNKGLFPGALPGGKPYEGSNRGLKPGALGFLKNKYGK
jgi:hypothetical protein